jgi:hypothetical protein
MFRPMNASAKLTHFRRSIDKRWCFPAVCSKTLPITERG